MNSNANIGNNNGCFSQDTLIKYLKGELSGTEMNAIERHLSGCAMCSDELEGISLLDIPQNIKLIVDDINQKIDASLNVRSKKLWSFSSFKAAASILVILTLSGLLYFTSTLRSPTTILSERLAVEEEKIFEEAIEDDTLLYEDRDLAKTMKTKGNEVAKMITDYQEPIIVADEIIELYELDVVVPEEKVQVFAEPKSVSRMAAGVTPTKTTTPKSLSLEQFQVAESVKILTYDADAFEEKFRKKSEIQVVTYNADEEEYDEEEVFAIVEEMPRFTWGEENLTFREYVAKNLKYPTAAAEMGIQGKVFIEFVVEVDGRVTNVRIIRGVDPALDREAVRVIESSPKWNPGKQRGKAVRVSFTFPVIFSLQ